MQKSRHTPLETKEQLVSRKRFLTGFTLTEVLVALLIIIILVSLSIPNFTKPKQAALDRRAKTALMLVLAAEKVYYLKMGFYYPYTGGADVIGINSYLKLNLSDENWDYTIGQGGLDAFSATAYQGSDGSSFRITRDDEQAAGPYDRP